MPFRLRIFTPDIHLSYEASCRDIEPSAIDIHHNHYCSSYSARTPDQSLSYNEIVDARDADQTFSGSLLWISNQGFRIRSLKLTRQHTPSPPAPFHPNENINQHRRPPTSAPASPTIRRRASSVPSPYADRPSTSDSHRRPNVLRRGLQPGPSRSQLSLDESSSEHVQSDR